MQKRHISPPRSFSSPRFLLFYLPDENKYVTISTSSSLLPANFDSNRISRLETINLKDNINNTKGKSFPAYFITIADTKDDIELQQNRLQAHIDRGNCIDKDSSLRFLQTSFNEEETFPSTSFEETSQEINIETSAKPSDNPSDLQTKKNDKCEMTPFEKESLRLQKEILRETQKCRKYLVRLSNRKSTDDALRVQTVTTQSSSKENIEPVLFDGKNLIEIKPYNMDIPQYAAKVARLLWTDEELMQNKLLPKRDTGRKGTLDTARSKLFSEAVSKRFELEDDDEELSAAIKTVNQLGSDLSRGKRHRK